MARKYRDFKKDPSIKTPLFAWLLNNAFFYIIIFAVFGISIGTALYNGYSMYVKMMAITPETSEYLVVNKEKPSSIVWAESLINTVPPGVEKWEVKPSSKPTHTVKIAGCNSVGWDLVPSSVLSTFTAAGDGIKTGLQIVNPGESMILFNKYVNEVKKCTDVDIVEYGEKGLKTMLYNDNSFLIVAGDTLLNVETKNASERSTLLDFYYNLLTTTLVETKCYNLNTSENDVNRTFYDNEDIYVGLQDSVTINTEVNVSGLPTPTSLTMNSVDVEKTYIEEPEAPLPTDFPVMPAETTQPVLPNFSGNTDNFSQDVSFRIKDVIGPGCGWEWHGQIPPVFNDETLDEAKKLAMQEAQSIVNTNAENYIKNDIAWNLKMIKLYPAINAWNIYVNKVNSVYDKWNWLNTERDKFAPVWYEYIGAYDTWKNFDAKKADAKTAYDSAVKVCDDAIKELDAWIANVEKLEREYNSDLAKYDEDLAKWKLEKEEWDKVKEENAGVNENPEPIKPEMPTLVVPDQPAGCPVPPTRPEILDQSKPDKPVAPKPPDGVTIPNSWPKAE